ncbi:MAG TPA: AraC family transcriptional regulator [Candidatus Acidoferrales bacterium]|nr:AraC family transcriptional regulator [Candidatus Acidoferrales bacterium]
MKTKGIAQRKLAPGNCHSRMHFREAGEIRKINESIGYMVRHLDKPLRVSTLATEVHISLSHFFCLFKRHVGSTPLDYFIRLRMRRARRLLEDTEMSVKAIAYTLGYDDPFYFSRIFKSFNGIAPSQYRSQKLAAGENNNQGSPANPLISRFAPAKRGFPPTTILAGQPAWS